MLICADKVGQSARESTREMNVASLCFLPATEGAEGLAFSFFSFFLLIPSRVLSFLFWFYRGMNWTREWAGEPEKAGAAGNALRESSE